MPMRVRNNNASLPRARLTTVYASCFRQGEETQSLETWSRFFFRFLRNREDATLFQRKGTDAAFLHSALVGFLSYVLISFDFHTKFL
jgi:hypothetical protein